MITGVGHCGAEGGTRATALTFCRSNRSFTTANGCKEGQLEAKVACDIIMHIYNMLCAFY